MIKKRLKPATEPRRVQGGFPPPSCVSPTGPSRGASLIPKGTITKTMSSGGVSTAAAPPQGPEVVEDGEEAPKVVACVCVLSRKNSVLFLRCVDKSQESYFVDSLVPRSLEVVEDCVERKVPQQDNFLGLLGSFDDYESFGYLTSTHVKVLAYLRSEKHVASEADLWDFFSKAHGAYVEHLLNPFNSIDAERIQAPTFLDKMAAAIKAHLDKPKFINKPQMVVNATVVANVAPSPRPQKSPLLPPPTPPRTPLPSNATAAATGSA